MPDQIVVTLRDLRKVYPGGKEAVKGINLSIDGGRIFGLIGANGAGKTSTIKMVAGLSRPTSGNVLFGGVDVWNLVGKKAVSARRNLGYLSERPLSIQRLTVYEYLVFIARLYGVPSSEIRPRIEGLLNYFQLLPKKNEFVEKCSAGMMKKVSFIAAVIGDPGILLFDEPFTDLDPESIYLAKRLMQDARSQGKTIILSTHFLNMAAEIVDRFAIMSTGTILYEGEKDGLAERVGMPRGSSLESLYLKLCSEGLETRHEDE